MLVLDMLWVLVIAAAYVGIVVVGARNVLRERRLARAGVGSVRPQRSYPPSAPRW